MQDISLRERPQASPKTNRRHTAGDATDGSHG